MVITAEILKSLELSSSPVTHIAATGYMFDIVFGATLRQHITKVQLLIKDLYLEK